MWKIEPNFKVRLGGNTYINIPFLIMTGDVCLFTMRRHDETGYLGIDFEIYDEKGNGIATVRRNEIYFGDKEKYQIEGSLNRYVFSERESGKVICDIKKREDAHPAELDVSAHLYTPFGYLLDFTPDYTNLPGNNIVTGCTFSNVDIGIIFDP